MRDKFNTYAVLTDSAKTITVTHTWERTQTFTPSSGVGINVTTGGISVTGTAALAAVTCTTLSATTSITCTNGSTANILAQTTGGAIAAKIYADGSNSWCGIGTFTNHALVLVTNSIVRGRITSGGNVEFDNNLTVTGTTTLGAVTCGAITAVGAFTASTGSFSSTLAVTGAATFSSTINGQTISAAASFTGSVAVANGLTVAAGTTAVQALTCTTLAPSGITTLSGTGTTYALDFTGAAGRLRLSNNGSLTVVENDGATAIMTITESTGGVAFAGKVTTRASSTATSGLNLPHGSAPTSPANGDVWTTTAGVFVRVNGTTVGPLLDSTSGGVTGSGTSGTLTKWTGSGAVGNSIITESGTTVTVANTLAATTVQTGTTSISNSGLFVGGQKVVGAQRTGWTAATGTDTRSTFATGSVTTAQLAERVKALIDDLLAHGLLTA